MTTGVLNPVQEWPRARRREFICEIIKSGKTMIQIAKEQGIGEAELRRNGFYSLSRFWDLKEQLQRWREG